MRHVVSRTADFNVVSLKAGQFDDNEGQDLLMGTTGSPGSVILQRYEDRGIYGRFSEPVDISAGILWDQTMTATFGYFLDGNTKDILVSIYARDALLYIHDYQALIIDDADEGAYILSSTVSENYLASDIRWDFD